MSMNLQNLTTEMTFDELVNAGYDKTELCDSVTWASIVEWFGLRRVQPNFDRYFSRAIKMYYPKYLELLRVEPGSAEYDWFVENYKEQWSRLTAQSEKVISGEKSVTKTGLDGGSVTVSSTDGNTRTLNTRDVDTSTGTDGHTGSNSSSSADVERETDAGRVAPMSGSFSGSRSATAGGSSKSMAWNDITNPTQAEDKLRDSARNESGSDSYSDTHSNSDDSQHTGTITDSASGSRQTTNNLTHSETSTNNEDGTITNDNNSITELILKGRDKGVAELLDAATAVIVKTNAFDWFRKQLDGCFMMCL